MKNDQGEEVSTKEIKKILETIIAEEDKKKPYRRKISDLLKEKGYPIATKNHCKISRTIRGTRCSFTKRNLDDDFINSYRAYCTQL